MTAVLPTWLRTLRRHVSRHAPASIGALLVTALLLGAITAARRYFYCSGMEQSMFAPCCLHHDSEVSQPTDRVQLRAASESCCETREFRAAAPAVEARGYTIGAAPVVAAVLATSSPTSISDRWVLRLPPTRAGPRPAAAQRALLQVYLC